MNACILACTSLRDYVDAAQASRGTAWPVFWLDRSLHAEPDRMKAAAAERIASLPEEFDTVLVAMGFCGGVWDHVRFDRRVVIPRTDDCVSLLLHRDDGYHPNLKEEGHLYIYEKDPADFSATRIMSDHRYAEEELKGLNMDYVLSMWFSGYGHLDIIDTGLNDCYTEEYAAAAQRDADLIHADLDYVPGSNLLLEKLVSGRWDGQFLVAEPGHLLIHGDFFE